MEALQDRIRRLVAPCINSQFSRCSDVLEEHAVSLAGDLWAAAVSVSASLETIPADVLSTLALLHWCRYKAKPEGEDRDDFQASMHMFARLHAVQPDRVPEGLRQLVSTNDLQMVEDNDGNFGFEPFSYLEQTYPSVVPAIRVLRDRQADITFELNMDTSDPRTLAVLMQAYHLSAHLTAQCRPHEMFSHLKVTQSALVPASAFHLVSTATGDPERVCILQAHEFHDQSTISAIYTGEGDMGNAGAKWFEDFILKPFTEASTATRGAWTIGAIEGMASRWPQTRVLPLTKLYPPITW